jgi:hypothetical protein
MPVLAPVAPMQPMPSAIYPQPMMTPVRRRRRRRLRIRRRPVRRRAPAVAMMPPPPQMMPEPAPPPPPVPVPPQVASDASGGMSGFGYYGYPVGALYGCARCGGFHGYGRCQF